MLLFKVAMPIYAIRLDIMRKKWDNQYVEYPAYRYHVQGSFCKCAKWIPPLLQVLSRSPPLFWVFALFWTSIKVRMAIGTRILHYSYRILRFLHLQFLIKWESNIMGKKIHTIHIYLWQATFYTGDTSEKIKIENNPWTKNILGTIFN